MTMNLLFSIDQSFVEELKTTLWSIRANSNEEYAIYVIQKEPLTTENELAAFCRQLEMTYHPIYIQTDDFKEAPVSERYPETIYYRLLAHNYLPETLDKILYLDADILCINDLKELYEIDLGNYLYAAASHSGLTNISYVVNKVRLKNYAAGEYFNSGVLLMNLPLIREEIQAQTIFSYIRENHTNLFLPDQDILNALYGDRILPLPDELYNYDARNYFTYQMLGNGAWDTEWVINNTVLLHFCGKDKPWKNDYSGKFDTLYKHYKRQTERLEKQKNF